MMRFQTPFSNFYGVLCKAPESVWTDTTESRPPFANTNSSNTMVGYYRAFQDSFTCLRNVTSKFDYLSEEIQF